MTGVALASLLALLVVRVGWRDLLEIRRIAPAAAALLLLVAASVHVMILWNLSNSFDAVGAPAAVAAAPGFEPVIPAAPQPVVPTGSGDAPPATR